MTPDRSWGAVVFRVSPDNSGKREYLLVQLASGMHWDHPKGHPEDGETPRQTARREVQEEGGVDIRFIEPFLGEAEWILPNGRPKKTGYFLAEQIGILPAGGLEGEILNSVWLEYPEAMRKITYESGRKILKEAESFLNNQAPA